MESFDSVILNMRAVIDKNQHSLDTLMYQVKTFEKYTAEPNEVEVKNLITSIQKLKQDTKDLKTQLAQLRLGQRRIFDEVTKKIEKVREQQNALVDKLFSPSDKF